MKSQIKIRTANEGAIIGIVILEGCYFLLCSRVRTCHASGGGLNPSEVAGGTKSTWAQADGWLGLECTFCPLGELSAAD